METFKLSTVETTKPSPLGMYIFSRYTESEDYLEAGVNSVESMKAYASKEVVSLSLLWLRETGWICKSGRLRGTAKVQGGAVRGYSQCYSTVQGLRRQCFWRRSKTTTINRRERDPVRTRRSADVVLSYGKKGVVATISLWYRPSDGNSCIVEDAWNLKTSFMRIYWGKAQIHRETKKYWILRKMSESLRWGFATAAWRGQRTSLSILKTY